jgi:hypothetical protein
VRFMKASHSRLSRPRNVSGTLFYRALFSSYYTPAQIERRRNRRPKLRADR